MIFELSRANKANPREALGSTILIFDYGVSPLFDTQPLICLDSGLVKSTSGSNVHSNFYEQYAMYSGNKVLPTENFYSL